MAVEVHACLFICMNKNDDDEMTMK